MIQTRGPQLIESLTDRYVSETVGIIDEYVERVTDSLRNEVGCTCTYPPTYLHTCTCTCT